MYYPSSFSVGFPLFQGRSGESFTYFAGSGWSKADMPTQPDWNDYLVRFQELQNTQLPSPG
jgi:hypothetical protein